MCAAAATTALRFHCSLSAHSYIERWSRLSACVCCVLCQCGADAVASGGRAAGRAAACDVGFSTGSGSRRLPVTSGSRRLHLLSGALRPTATPQHKSPAARSQIASWCCKGKIREELNIGARCVWQCRGYVHLFVRSFPTNACSGGILRVLWSRRRRRLPQWERVVGAGGRCGAAHSMHRCGWRPAVAWRPLAAALTHVRIRSFFFCGRFPAVIWAAALHCYVCP